MNGKIQLRKAERKQTKLRVGFSGPAGSGKTYSALLVAYGITGDWKKIAIIDSENGSGELYSDLGEYNVITLDAPFSPERYIEAIEACEQAGVEVVIIDSVTHEWDGKGGCLESNDLIANSKFKGNTWAAWSVTTPRHQKFIQKIVTSSCHVITTARSKTDTIQTEDKKIKKVGLKEIQREGFEYELTLNFTIDRDGHYAVASKDRTGIFSELDPFVITSDVGKTLMEWVSKGKPVVVDVTEKQKGKISYLLKQFGEVCRDAKDYEKTVFFHTNLKLEPANYAEIISRLEVLLKEKRAADKERQESGETTPPTQTPETPPVSAKTAPKTTEAPKTTPSTTEPKSAVEEAFDNTPSQ
jgi:hypothetical protein